MEKGMMLRRFAWGSVLFALAVTWSVHEAVAGVPPTVKRTTARVEGGNVRIVVVGSAFTANPRLELRRKRAVYVIRDENVERPSSDRILLLLPAAKAARYDSLAVIARGAEIVVDLPDFEVPVASAPGRSAESLSGPMNPAQQRKPGAGVGDRAGKRSAVRDKMADEAREGSERAPEVGTLARPPARSVEAPGATRQPGGVGRGIRVPGSQSRRPPGVTGAKARTIQPSLTLARAEQGSNSDSRSVVILGGSGLEQVIRADLVVDGRRLSIDSGRFILRTPEEIRFLLAGSAARQREVSIAWPNGASDWIPIEGWSEPVTIAGAAGIDKGARGRSGGVDGGEPETAANDPGGPRGSPPGGEAPPIDPSDSCPASSPPLKGGYTVTQSYREWHGLASRADMSKAQKVDLIQAWQRKTDTPACPETPLFGEFDLTWSYPSGKDTHTGVDIANGSCGGDVLATRAGEVTFYGEANSGGYGNAVLVEHDDGSCAVYGHLEMSTITRGRVCAGAKIGTVGKTGKVTGCHLHLESRAPSLCSTLLGAGLHTYFEPGGSCPNTKISEYGYAFRDPDDIGFRTPSDLIPTGYQLSGLAVDAPRSENRPKILSANFEHKLSRVTVELSPFNPGDLYFGVISQGKDRYLQPSTRIHGVSNGVTLEPVEMLEKSGEFTDNWFVEIKKEDGRGSLPFRVFCVDCGSENEPPNPPEPPRAPELTAINPNPVEISSDPQWITLRGSGFLAPVEVKFYEPSGGLVDITKVDIDVDSETTVRVRHVFGGLEGRWDAEVAAVGGVTSRKAFDVVGLDEPEGPEDSEVDPPRVTSLSPKPVPGLDVRQWITILGSDFVEPIEVTLYDTQGTPFAISETRIEWKSESRVEVFANVDGDDGTWQVQLVAGGQASSPVAFVVSRVEDDPEEEPEESPVDPDGPRISSISPEPVPGLSDHQWVSIYGSAFVDPVQVSLFDTVGDEYKIPDDRTEWVSESEVRVYANMDEDDGRWDAEVTASGQKSDRISFVVSPIEEAEVIPEPRITSISPDPVPALTVQQWVTIRGEDFIPPIEVTLYDTRGDSYEIPSSRTDRIGDSEVKIFANMDGDDGRWYADVRAAGGESSKRSFDVDAVESLRLTDVAPDPVPPLTDRQWITIYGEGIDFDAVVTLTDTTGVDFPIPSSRTGWKTSTETQVFANVAGDVGRWTATIENADGSTDQIGFDVR